LWLIVYEIAPENFFASEQHTHKPHHPIDRVF